MRNRGEEFKKADLLEFKGSELYSKGEYGQALEAYAEAASIFDDLWSENPDDQELKYRVASAINNSGSVLMELGVRDAVRNRAWDADRIDSVRDSLIYAVSLFAELWDSNRRRPAFGNDLAATLNNLGYLISFSNKPEGAETFLLESLRVRQDVQSRFPYDHLAIIGQYQTAQQLLALYEKLGDSSKAAPMREQVKRLEQTVSGISSSSGQAK